MVGTWIRGFWLEFMGRRVYGLALLDLIGSGMDTGVLSNLVVYIARGFLKKASGIDASLHRLFLTFA